MRTTPFQDSLFEPADKRNLTVVELVLQTKPQDKQQAKFQRLIKQIHDQRMQVEEWHRYRERYHLRVSSEMMPIYTELRAKRIAMTRMLDEQFRRPNAIRGKRLRSNLSAMILELTVDLLNEEHDPDIVALHDRYSNLSHAEQAELDKAFSQDMVENMFGVRLDEEDSGASMEEMIAKAAEKLRQETDQKNAQQPPRRKSAKAAAAEEKRAAAEKEVSLSVREVYRKLASVLHPDRASDDLTPEQKTALMQRVNRAYDSGNLLELLNIQLEIEQIDAAHLSNLSAERVAHYNQVLREQLAELKAELESLVAPYRSLLPYTPNLKPQHVDMGMDRQIAELKTALREVKSELSAWQDPKYLAIVLKQYEPRDDFDDFDDLIALEAMMDNFCKPPTQSRRRKR